MGRYGQARDKGGAYLLEQMRPDGGFGIPELGVADYYKVPAALQVCGHTERCEPAVRLDSRARHDA